MKSSRNADAQARSALRRFRRRHDRRSKAHRTCEAIAAFIPALVFLFHLATRAADITPPEKREHHPITLTEPPETNGKVAIAKPVTVVPEPNVLVFVGLSFAALAYSRRKLKAAALQSVALAPTAQSSKIAIAAA